MKQIYLITLLFIVTKFAQAPAGYYNNATGSGYTLKTQLYNIIKDHTVQDYAGLVTYDQTDIDKFYENDGSVLDMYSENPAGVDPYNYSILHNDAATIQMKEIVTTENTLYHNLYLAQLPNGFNAHFITPTDGKVNGIRSNYPIQW
jgi:hypothetical protein